MTFEFNPTILPSRLLCCHGQHPWCGHRSIVAMQIGNVAQDILHYVVCNNCKREKRSRITYQQAALNSNRPVALAELFVRNVNLRPVPPFGAGPAVQG